MAEATQKTLLLLNNKDPSIRWVLQMGVSVAAIVSVTTRHDDGIDKPEYSGVTPKISLVGGGLYENQAGLFKICGNGGGGNCERGRGYTARDSGIDE